ncbi:MAG: DUF222 domain-containing protein [Ilumatobacteraceae bacterium]
MSITGVVQRLEGLAIDRLDVGEVVAGLGDVARVKGFVAELEHALLRRANTLASQGSGPPGEEVLGRSGRVSRREAARTTRRAEVLGVLPAMSAQVRKGRVGTEHADALASAAGRLDEADRAVLFDMDAELAQTAAASTPGEFRRFLGRVTDRIAADAGEERSQRQRRSMTLAKGIDADSGMYWLRGEFDPETGARVFAAIDAETTALAHRREHTNTPRERLAAHALADLATSANRSKRPGKVELLAIVDIETITTGVHDHSTGELSDGTVLPVATIRRLACDAHIIPVVLNGDGVALDVGRSQRLATDDQRRALRAMYRTCGIGNCDTPFDQCEIHHLDEWTAHHGQTNLDRLIPACQRHHHLAHEGRWRLDLDPVSRELTITLPDGTIDQRSRPHAATAPTVRTAA